MSEQKERWLCVSNQLWDRLTENNTNCDIHVLHTSDDGRTIYISEGAGFVLAHRAGCVVVEKRLTGTIVMGHKVIDFYIKQKG